MRLMSFCCVAMSAAMTRGDRADPRDDGERVRRGLDEKADAHQHVNAGGHHRRGVDQRGDRRRAFHRVRQPDVQRELRGLADRAAEDQQRRDGEIAGMTGDAAQLLARFR